MSAPLQNTFFKTNITGNLDIAGNLSVNSQNVYLGYLAGSTNANVDNMKNVAIGSSCATYQTGSNNVSIGYDAATNSTTTYTGVNNVSIGYNSGFNSSVASNGVALGVNSLVDFSGSIAIGSSATATGFRNIAIGASATSSGTASKGNSIAIGVGASTGSYGNSVAIGLGAVSTVNDQIALGTSNCYYSFPPLTNQVFTCYTEVDYTFPVSTGGIYKIPFNNNFTPVIDTSLITYSNGDFTVKRNMVLAISFLAYFKNNGTDFPFAGVYIDNYQDGYRYGQNILTTTTTTEKGVSTLVFLSLDVNNQFSCNIVFNNGIGTFTRGYATIFCL